MHLERHHFDLFGNREEIAMNIMICLFSFGEGLISIFVPVYLWQHGFSLPAIMGFYFLNSFYYVLVFFLLFDWLKKISDKAMLLVSLPFSFIYYFGLTYLDQYPFLFYVLPLALVLNIFLFWIGYHVNYTCAIDGNHVGRSVGIQHLFLTICKLLAPFIGGLIIYFNGFANAFNVAATIMLLAFVPILFFSQKNFLGRFSRKDIFKNLVHPKIKPYAISDIGYAAESSINRILWPLFMFLAIGSIREYGAVVSIGLGVGAIVSLLVGIYSDRGERRKLLGITTGLYSLVCMIKGFFILPVTIVGANIASDLVSGALGVAWSTEFYQIAKKVDCGLFVVGREVLNHLVRIIFWPIWIALAFLLPLNIFFIAVFIAGGLLSLLYYYANQVKE